jgi:hypothetical protein
VGEKAARAAKKMDEMAAAASRTADGLIRIENEVNTAKELREAKAKEDKKILDEAAEEKKKKVERADSIIKFFEDLRKDNDRADKILEGVLGLQPMSWNPGAPMGINPDWRMRQEQTQAQMLGGVMLASLRGVGQGFGGAGGVIPAMWGGGESGSSGRRFSPLAPDLAGAAALRVSAKRLGLDPVEYGALMDFESGINPNRWGGAGGKYLGLIQFGPEERKRYHVQEGQTIGQQVQAAENFLLDRGFIPGQSDIRHAYSAILTGRADSSRWNLEDKNHTTVNKAVPLFKSGVHYERAKQFLQDSQSGRPSSDAPPPPTGNLNVMNAPMHGEIEVRVNLKDKNGHPLETDPPRTVARLKTAGRRPTAGFA